MPLAFEENRGQIDPAVHFLSHQHGYSLFLTPTEMMLTLAAAPRDKDVHAPLLPLLLSHQIEKPPLAITTLRFAFVGAHPNPVMRGEEPLDGSVNYFIGDDPRQWQTNITTTAKVRYSNLYDGNDLVAYGDQGNQLEYDAIVAPGADPTQFALGVTGADHVALSPEGDLIIQTASGDVRQRAPLLYQEIGGVRRSIEGGYTLHADGRIGFRVGAYDHTAPLVIDPVTLLTVENRDTDHRPQREENSHKTVACLPS